MAETCRVDFYVLQDESQSEDALACRLALMAWEQGFRTLLLAPDAGAAERLDRLMWSQPPERFLPHAHIAAAGADQAPVLIAAAGEPCDVDCAVVINLSRQAIRPASGVRRLLEIVPAEAALRKAARDKFREYRDLGLEPVSHDISRAV